MVYIDVMCRLMAMVIAGPMLGPMLGPSQSLECGVDGCFVAFPMKSEFNYPLLHLVVA